MKPTSQTNRAKPEVVEANLNRPPTHVAEATRSAGNKHLWVDFATIGICAFGAGIG